MDAPSGASSSKNDSSSDTKTYTNISKFGKIYPLLTLWLLPDFQKELDELRMKCVWLERANHEISRKNKLLYDENHFLAKINDEFGKENDELQERIDWFLKYQLPKSFRQQKNDDNHDDEFGHKSKKRWLKGKKLVHCFTDELEYNLTNSNSSNELVTKELNVKEARVCLILVL